jgi:APA family basic amino acid/polyamine antiporter
MQSAVGSAAPIGDMMVVVGNAILGPGNGRIFMEFEAFTVFLAIIGTTLSCMNTGARVTYAMGKDEELPDSMGGCTRKPDPAPRHLDAGGISAVVGCVTVLQPVRRRRRSRTPPSRPCRRASGRVSDTSRTTRWRRCRIRC